MTSTNSALLPISLFPGLQPLIYAAAAEITFRAARTQAEIGADAWGHPNCGAHLLRKGLGAAASYQQTRWRKHQRCLSAPAESEPAADGASFFATTLRCQQFGSVKQTMCPAERRANSNPNIPDEILPRPLSHRERRLAHCRPLLASAG